MEKVFENDFIHFFYDAKTKVLKFLWQAETWKLTNEDFKNIVKIQVEHIKTHKPDFLLINIKDFQFAIEPDLQEWTDEQIFPEWIAANVKKVGFVASDDMIAQISVEQTMSEEVGKKVKSKFFHSEEEAKNWLFE